MGPQPFAATPPQHLAAMAVPCWLLLLPRKASSSGEHRGLTTLLHPQHQATEEKPPNHSIWKLNAVEERQYICHLFVLFCFGPSGSYFLSSSPHGNAKITFWGFFTERVHAGMDVLKQMSFPHNLNLQSISRKQDIK